ncbi:hypothetical protein ACQKGC_23865 [Allorhizobium pseudoryzae]|uniref:hypothetical protein n=1 Tax=Allorhizobium pseudoryzae TaxID=379684 RepID=UPI003D037C87
MDRIWNQEPTSNWPIDFGRYIFIGRAVQKVGRALFGHEWTDAAPSQSQTPEFRRKRRLTVDDLWHNWQIIKALLSEEELATITKAPYFSRPPVISAEVWSIAIPRLNETKLPFQRYKDVQSQMLEWFRSGAVRTGIRAHRGGEIVEADSSLWNSEDLSFRFDYGKLDANRPFEPVDGLPPETLSWIFVEQESLGKTIPDIFAPKPQAEKAAQSELLRFAINFNEDFPLHTFPKKADLIKAIDRAWRLNHYMAPGDPIRDERSTFWRNMPDLIATVLLDMDDRRGKNSVRYKATQSKLIGKKKIS